MFEPFNPPKSQKKNGVHPKKSSKMGVCHQELMLRMEVELRAYSLLSSYMCRFNEQSERIMFWMGDPDQEKLEVV